jgi:hypothetical protein
MRVLGKRAASRRSNRPVVCVRSRDGWCATSRNHTRYADIVPTICGYKVVMPFGIERRTPDCPECLRRTAS